MVQGIQEDRKTVTRRLNNLDFVNSSPGEWKFYKLLWNEKNGLQAFFKDEDDPHSAWGCRCPYGNIGDLLWVRETYTILEPEHCTDGMKSRFYFKADHHESNEEWRKECIADGYPYKWIPSIHMKKDHARIWLKITDIRVERLQNITEESAKAEGVESKFKKYKEDKEDGAIVYKNYRDNSIYLDPKSSFCSLWVKINGKGSWELNPWVWVIQFEKCN